MDPINPDMDDAFSYYINYEDQSLETVTFTFTFGEYDNAAVYSRQSRSSSKSHKGPNNMPPTTLLNLLKQDLLDIDVVGSYVLQCFEERSAYSNSLVALGRVTDFYKRNIPLATISMGIMKSPLSTWIWMRPLFEELDNFSLDIEALEGQKGSSTTIYPIRTRREHAFAAILQFESGVISAAVSDLDKVLAISSGSSLFIADEILQDPIIHSKAPSCAISYVMGNIGKPGIALLIPPPEPEVRKHDLEKWRLVEHNPFDGNLAGGRFEGTSIHLSFTGWEGPISLHSSRYQGMEAYYVETLVSAFDGGEWVGDLDVLKGLAGVRLREEGAWDPVCSHDPSFSAAGVEITTIDCWEELLDPPEQLLVLRSASSIHNQSLRWQWMVRLAAVSIAQSKNSDCICLHVDRDFCWTCVVRRSRPSQGKRALYIRQTARLVQSHQSRLAVIKLLELIPRHYFLGFESSASFIVASQSLPRHEPSLAVKLRSRLSEAAGVAGGLNPWRALSPDRKDKRRPSKTRSRGATRSDAPEIETSHSRNNNYPVQSLVIRLILDPHQTTGGRTRLSTFWNLFACFSLFFVPFVVRSRACRRPPKIWTALPSLSWMKKSHLVPTFNHRQILHQTRRTHQVAKPNDILPKWRLLASRKGDAYRNVTPTLCRKFLRRSGTS